MDEPPRVHHWMMCLHAEARSSTSPFNPYMLDGVCYRYRVHPSSEMSMADPKPIRSLRLFARFFGGAGGWDFEVEVRWLDDPDDGAGDGTVTEVYGPFTVHFREGESVRDFIFPLRNVPLCGTGRYEFRLMALDASRFGDDWEPLAVEYFEVTRT